MLITTQITFDSRPGICYNFDNIYFIGCGLKRMPGAIRARGQQSIGNGILWEAFGVSHQAIS